MEAKTKYIVNNPSDTFISMQGHSTLTIPNNCTNHIIELFPATAKKTIASLRGRFPFLDIKEYKETETVVTTVVKNEEVNVESAGNVEDKTDNKSSKKNTK